MVGDRLDTDIEGAPTRPACDSLLVLTGVTGLAELVGGAASELRPTYVAADLAGLAGAAPGAGDRAETGCASAAGRAHGRATAGSTVEGDGAARTGGGWWRRPAWRHLDDAGEPVARWAPSRRPRG